jgi:hypothetical protein
MNIVRPGRYRTLFALVASGLLALMLWHRRSHNDGQQEPARSGYTESLAPPAPRAAEGPTAPRGQPAIHGTVIGEAGAGARASIMAVKAGMLSADAPRFLTESGADGRFVLTGVEPGRYEVWAWSAEGHGASTSCEVVHGPTSVELRLEQSGAQAHGTVRDGAGGTVAAAELRVVHVNAGLDRAVAFAKSDADGRYRLRLPQGNYLARVSASGYALTQGVLQVGKEGAEQDFTLSPAAAIAGRVVREGGAPAPGTTLTLRPARLDTIQAQWPRIFQAHRDGTFSARAVPPGSYLLIAETDGESATFGPFQLEAGEERSELELTLAGRQRLRVEVIADRGLPITGVTIEVKQDQAGVPSRNVSIRSDPQGVAEARGLFPGHSTVVVADHPDYEQRVEPLGALAPQAESRVVQLILRRAARLTGRVLSGAGEPVAEARVSVDVSGSPGGAYASTLSDEKGEFALRVALGAEAGSRYVVEARHPEKGLVRLEVADTARALTLNLSAGLYVDGVVRDERGAAVPFARVSASQVEPRTRGSEALDIADAEGVFRIGPFDPAVVKVELQGAVIIAPSSRARARVDLRSGRGDRVNLVAPARQSRVSGRVLDEHGEPMVGVMVLLAPERFGTAARTEGTPALTDGRGAFDCEGLHAGPHRVFVEALGYDSIERAVVAPGVLEIRMETSSTALARVPAPPSAPEADVED